MTALYYYHTPPRPVPTLPKPHHPLLCTITLASLVKGEVLSPEKIRATTGGIASPPSLLAPTLPKPHYPTPHTNTLASPRKRGGGLQTSERLENSALLCDISNAGIFAIILSARRWGLIPISTINEIFRTIPQKALSLLPYERSVGFASHCLVSH